MSRFSRKTHNDPVIDIERLLVDYAWRELADPSCLDRLVKNRKYRLEVNWGYVDISHHVTSFRPRPRDSMSPEGANVAKLAASVTKRDLCLFRTEFKNASSDQQTFTFKTERTTTSRCEINLQKGYKIGSNVDVRVTIPGVEGCRVTGALSGELQVTKTTGQTFEEQLTWSVDSQINVAGKTKAVAALMIREEEVNADLTVDSIIRPLYDVIPVYVRLRKNNQLLELIELPSTDLPDILSDSEGFQKVGDCSVKRETKGVVRLVYGAEQVIDLKTEPLELAHAQLSSSRE